MSKKQDRQGVRTAAALEQKYRSRLGGENSSVASHKLETQIQQLSQSLAQFIGETNRKLEELKSVDITQTWFGSGVPTLENAPAIDWSDEIKATHIGDLYYNEDDERLYLFKSTNGVYEWASCSSTSIVTDTETYSVTFYGGEEVIASYIIRQGDAVNPPINEADWVDGEGVAVTFPYSPTNDTNLYIVNEESTL